MTQLTESLKQHDLINLVSNKIHIDEYKSKMGSDNDVIVLSFKVKGKEPGLDLVDYIEKSQPNVLDADVSSGELDDGEYLVFVELERRHSAVEDIITLVDELKNLVDIDIEDFQFRYTKDGAYSPLTFNALSRSVPLTSREYKSKYGKEPIDEIRTAAGLPIPKSRAKKTKYMDDLQVAAGIK
jgi:hypothetical protein